jgi:hypothetical protein
MHQYRRKQALHLILERRFKKTTNKPVCHSRRMVLGIEYRDPVLVDRNHINYLADNYMMFRQ